MRLGGRAKGPPPLPLRALAPALVATTVVIFPTGVLMLVLEHRTDLLLELHKVAFVVWGVLFGVHFLWHLPHVWSALAVRRRMRLPGAAVRGLLPGASAMLAVALLSHVEGWQRLPH